MDGDSLARIGFLALLLVAVGGYLVTDLRQRPGQTVRQAIVWGLIFLGVIAAAGLWTDIRGELSPRQMVTAEGRIELPRSRDGHYYATATLNGTDVRFVVDTGATDIVLSEADAGRIGIDTATLAYLGSARTANGIVQTAPVTIARMELGGVADRDVPAVVNAGQLRESLLGMRYLSRFGRVEIAGDRMILER